MQEIGGVYIGKKPDGRHVVTFGSGTATWSHVRHPQPSKREQLMSLVKAYKGGEEILVDEIMQICEVEE